ncbi:MAG: TrmH family RNA methyltransferase [Bacteriovoracaceae bacterium]
MTKEQKIYGMSAVMATFKARPQDIIKVFLTEKRLKDAKSLLKHCADQRKAYKIVTEKELEDITKATHHEGIALTILEKATKSVEEILKATKAPGLVIALEGVENPHNLGAILRIAAHFGASGILVKGEGKQISSAAAYRTAEGGAEYVDVAFVENWKSVFTLAQKYKFKTVATSSHLGESLYEFQYPDRTLLFMGAEGPGLEKDLISNTQLHVQIPGTKNVESLNVATATSTLLGEWFRQVKMD